MGKAWWSDRHYGVVVIMSPWNFPVDEILLLALPALGAGNTVIVNAIRSHSRMWGACRLVFGIRPSTLRLAVGAR
jgi:acyl-CoA reductase-like NAD-dependent aldehyde dehydrogenase